MLWTLFVILLILWLLGFALKVGGGLIHLILVIADMARSQPPMVGSFVAELTRRLQGQSYALALPLTWILRATILASFQLRALKTAPMPPSPRRSSST